MTSRFHRSNLGVMSPHRMIRSNNPKPTILVSLIARNHANQRLRIGPRSLDQPRSVVVRTVVRGGAWDSTPDGGDAVENAGPCSYAVDDVRFGDLVEKSGSGCGGDRTVAVERRSSYRTVDVMVAFAATVVLGVGNRVLYKLALVPLNRYPFFLAQLATFGYILSHSLSLSPSLNYLCHRYVCIFQFSLLPVSVFLLPLPAPSETKAFFILGHIQRLPSHSLTSHTLVNARI